MISLEQFQSEVVEKLPGYLTGDLENATVRGCEVTKNNNLVLHGISVVPEGSNIGPTIYLEGYYDQYEDGRDFTDILDAIAYKAKEHKEVPFEIGDVVKDFQNYDYIKERVVPVLVNAGRNELLLSQAPHQLREDLAIIYKVVVNETGDTSATITVKNEHMAVWGVSAEELHEVAMKNGQELFPANVRTMVEVLRSMCSSDEMSEEMADLLFGNMFEDNQMYIVSNSKGSNGAIAIFYDDVLSNLADKMGSDLYILPSSTHECIAISADISTPDDLRMMVMDVNASTVSIEEQLSDHVYRFNAATKELKLADTTAEELNMAAGQSQGITEGSDATEGSRPRHACL